MHDAGYYIDKFQQLRRDGVPGRWTKATANEAPHKPILLISVMDAYLENPNRSNSIEPSEHLRREFDKYWRRPFSTPRKGTLALPFFHLRSDGFWHLVPVQKPPSMDPRIDKSFGALQRAVRHATLDVDLHRLLSTPAWTTHLRSVLVAAYFAPELHGHFVAV